MTTSPLERRSGAATLRCQQILLPVGRYSAFVRPAHQLERRFDVPPSFGLFACALLFVVTSFLRSLGNGLLAMCLQELPGVVVDIDFVHPHGAISLSAMQTPIAEDSGRPCYPSRPAVRRPSSSVICILALGDGRVRSDLSAGCAA